MNPLPRLRVLGTRKLLKLLLITASFLNHSVFGQINSWTNPVSGNWEDLHWSLGVRPSSSQSVVYFTNLNWKAVQIAADTVLKYPGSLTISNLFLGAPEGSSNTLLLNFSGLQTPLRVLEQLRVGTNAALRLLSSRLDANKQFLVDSTVYHEDGSQAFIGQLLLGPGSSAAYFLASGLVSSTSEEIGGTDYTQALFSHAGGTNRATTLRVHARARYQFTAGSIRTGDLFVGDVPTIFYPDDLAGIFMQTSGQLVVTNDLRVGDGGQGAGVFVLSGGSVSSDVLRIGTKNSGSGDFKQFDGTNQCRLLVLSEGDNNPLSLPDNYSYSRYFLGNGRLTTSQSQLGAGRPCYFTQAGGVYEVTTALNISDGQSDYSYYFLNGGTLRSGSMRIDSAKFYHTSGTNQVSGNFELYGNSLYELSGGTLGTGGTFISDPGLYQDFRQSGGLHFATNFLQVGYSPTNMPTGDRYTLEGGQLTTPTIWLSGRFEHFGGALTPPNLYMYGGKWIAGVPYSEFHQLDPRGGFATISTIIIATNPCVLQFDGSLYPDWLATLAIENWSGSPNGGGAHRIRFGNSLGALGPLHLQHAWFINPAGFPAGLYQARILSTGEIVPGSQLKLSTSLLAGQLVLSWETSNSLLSATNVSGPYEYVPGSRSPFTNQFLDPARFFRLNW
jgi:hypothetical protein